MAKQDNSAQALLQLKAQLRAKDVGRLYFFHGEEVFLLDHYRSQLKKLLIDELTESFNYHKLNNDARADYINVSVTNAEGTRTVERIWLV